VALIDIITLNNLINPNFIYQGQEIVIPQQSDHIEAVAEPAKETSEPVEQETIDSKFIWPLENYTIINYYWAYHPGLDLVVDIGTTVFASGGGKVEFSGWNVNGYGYLVIIDHGGGVKTLYAHNSELLVVEGEKVEQGQQISLSGSTGYSTWPHVHYELIFNERVRVNPCQYLPGGCS
jgi:murein DD-endopeptidase MepM/ murein hydrolase activator NlpD